MDALQETVIRLYSQNVGLKEFERRKICAWSTARKILINAGLYETKKSKTIHNMLKTGLTVSEIATALNMSTKTVNSYMPYTRGRKNSEYPSLNALRIRACRERKRQAAKQETVLQARAK